MKQQAFKWILGLLTVFLLQSCITAEHHPRHHRHPHKHHRYHKPPKPRPKPRHKHHRKHHRHHAYIPVVMEMPAESNLAGGELRIRGLRQVDVDEYAA